MSRTFIIARRTLGRGTTFNDSFTTLTHFTTLMYVFLRFVFIIMTTNPAGEGGSLFGLGISESADVQVR